jgi:hypothetical protein
MPSGGRIAFPGNEDTSSLMSHEDKGLQGSDSLAVTGRESGFGL